jgi:uncharacterized integral membrane protein
MTRVSTASLSVVLPRINLPLVAVGLGSLIVGATVGASCPLRTCTGWECAGCGATRATAELLDRHLGSAIDYNAAFVLVLAAVASMGLLLAVSKVLPRYLQCRTGPALRTHTFVGGLVLWTGLRNLGPVDWLATSTG